MGLFDRWRGKKSEVVKPPESPRVLFTYSPLADLLQQNIVTGPVTRDLALTVPALARGRNLICSIATLPLVQRDRDNNMVPSPFLSQIDPDVPNLVTLSQTVEDLLMYGVAWWRITGFGWDGYPVSARRLDPLTVSVDPPHGRNPAPLPSGIDPRGGVVWVDGRPVSGAEIIRFDSPNPGVLTVGADTIRRAIQLSRAATNYASSPQPHGYLAPADGAEELTDDEIAELIAKWHRSRANGSTAYVPASLRYVTESSPSPVDLQLIELVKNSTLEIANLIGVDAFELGIEANNGTYSNINDRHRHRINNVLAPYMRAITDRLSMGDVTKRGYEVAFDLTDYLKANPAERASVQKTYVDMGVKDVEEVRAEEGLPPRTAPPAEEPTEPLTEEPLND